MNFVETVEKAIEKRNRILNAKKEELLLLENRKTSIEDDLKTLLLLSHDELTP